MPVTTNCWQTAPQSFSLSAGQLHLWRFRLDLPHAEIDLLQHYLNADELVRAKRLLIPEKQRQFIVARAQLRTLLAGYLAADPAELIFSYGHQGKPALLGHSDFYFNLAHSTDLALLAVTRSGEVGVDIERIDSSLDYAKLAERYFSADELSVLNSVSKQRRKRTFYRLWTRKESLLKLSGEGFGTAKTHQYANLPVRLKSLPIAKNYLGCVCYPAEITSIVSLQLFVK